MFWVLFAALTTVLVYIFYVRPMLVQYRFTSGIYARLNAAELTGWERFKLLFNGAKTNILALVGVVTLNLPDVLQQLGAVDWSPFGEGTATKIGTALMIGVMITHMLGIVHASRLDPNTPPEQRIPEAE